MSIKFQPNDFWLQLRRGDMGGNVSSIHLLSKLIQVKGWEGSASNHLKEMQFQTLELGQKLKDIVWATKSKNDN